MNNRDPNTVWLRPYRDTARSEDVQALADATLEAEWRRRVRVNEQRRQYVRQIVMHDCGLLRTQAE